MPGCAAPESQFARSGATEYLVREWQRFTGRAHQAVIKVSDSLVSGRQYDCAGLHAHHAKPKGAQQGEVMSGSTSSVEDRLRRVPWAWAAPM